MWLLAGAIFLGCKWQTWCDAVATERAAPAWSVAYLLAWPGMDARRFLAPQWRTKSADGEEWVAAAGKTFLGAVVFWGAARAVAQESPLLAGWLGMIGLVFLLHFGTFHLVALLWRRQGAGAEPIMRSPHRAESLADFWGARWNLGFRHLTHNWVFRPLRRRGGIAIATLSVFLVSGLIHDLVISLPAGAGYGLPTGYFLLQGFGVLAERSRIGRETGLGRELRGRLFLLAVAALPLPMLFHGPFVQQVILPCMRATGAQ